MMTFLLFLLPIVTFAQSPMDQHRWYLNPQNEEILISIDDLHDERLIASSELQWGKEAVKDIELKKDVVIAVIDGGIEIEHPELKNHIAYNSSECFEGNVIPPKDGEDKDQNGYKGDCAGWDFVEGHNRPEDQDGHGTHVTGVIRSVMTGVRGNFKFLPLKTFAPGEGRDNVKVTTALPIRLTRAFEYAISRKVDVIHLSVGWPKSFMTFELEEVIKKAQKLGIIIVAAAGNSSQRATIYPCQMEGVICTGAIRPDGTVARFSNWGSQVDIFAPGEKILSTIPHTIAPLHISRRGYDYKNGTSQAAPFISAVMALLRGENPHASVNELYSKLMLGSKNISEGKGLKGMFNLLNSLNQKPVSFVYPMLKGLHSVVQVDQNFEMKIPVKNFWMDSNRAKAQVICDEARLNESELTIPALKTHESFVLNVSGTLTKKSNYLNCSISIGKETLELRLKVLNKLNTPFKRILVKQDELLVINTRTGARSRFTTINAIKGTTPAPLYYVTGDKTITLYNQDVKLGNPEASAGCSFLRIWQVDLNADQTNDFMVESLCDKTHLKYQFMDQSLKEIFPASKYKPTLTIVNYEDFEIIPQKGLPPVFKFMNIGFLIPTETPWDSDVTGKAMHLYELVPVKDGDSFKYDVRVFEEPQKWMKSLGLRYLPNYEVLHLIDNRLLVKIGVKTAWVNLHDQSAVWANLDYVLLSGSRKQNLIGSKDVVLQSFLTPFEYRGFLMNGVRLRFIQENRFDPLIDILGTEKNDRGYKTVVRSFQKLMYLQYDERGVLVERKESVVDRFDFLTAQDLIASVANLAFNGSLIQLVDGTKVNTNYVDLMADGKMESFEIPSSCATQNPVVLDGVLVLPVFCAKNKTEFEMRFIDLKN